MRHVTSPVYTKHADALAEGVTEPLPTGGVSTPLPTGGVITTAGEQAKAAFAKGICPGSLLRNR